MMRSPACPCLTRRVTGARWLRMARAARAARAGSMASAVTALWRQWSSARASRRKASSRAARVATRSRRTSATRRRRMRAANSRTCCFIRKRWTGTWNAGTGRGNDQASAVPDERRHARSSGAARLNRVERRAQVVAQVFDVFDADRQAYQAVSDAQLGPLFCRDACMRHQGRVFDQAFHAAQAFGQGKHFAAFQEAARASQVGIEVDRDDAAEAIHLALGQRMLRMRFQAWIKHLAHFFLLFQPLRQRQSALAVALHADGQGFYAAQSQEAVERAGDRAYRILQKAQLFAPFR